MCVKLLILSIFKLQLKKISEWSYFVEIMPSSSCHRLIPDMSVDHSNHWYFEHSSNYMHAECDFIMLVNKRAILQYAINMKFESWAPLRNTCICLHVFFALIRELEKGKFRKEGWLCKNLTFNGRCFCGIGKKLDSMRVVILLCV